MRGEASRIADRVLRDSLAPKLRDSGEDTWRIGNELFTITNVLDHNIQLERALTDPSRPVEDKVAVVKTLIGDEAHPLTMEIMSDLVARRWSRVSDIANATEDFGVDGMMYYADHTNATLQVSIELAQLHSALLNLPVVRSKLYDATVPAEARIKLLYSLIGNADFNVVTKRLAEHATCNLRNRRYLQTIQWLINKFSRHMGESMVTVTTATPLSKEQVEKLIAIYTATVIGIILVVILGNRNPLKTIPWVVVLIFAPVVGLVFYFFFGQDLRRKRIISRRTYKRLMVYALPAHVRRSDAPVPAACQSLSTLLTNTSQAVSFYGSRLTHYGDGASKMTALLEEIEKARDHIHILYYIFCDDETGARLQQALIRKAKEGVKVRVLYDDVGCNGVKKEFFQQMRDAGEIGRASCRERVSSPV